MLHSIFSSCLVFARLALLSSRLQLSFLFFPPLPKLGLRPICHRGSCKGVMTKGWPDHGDSSSGSCRGEGWVPFQIHIIP